MTTLDPVIEAVASAMAQAAGTPFVGPKQRMGVSQIIDNPKDSQCNSFHR